MYSKTIFIVISLLFASAYARSVRDVSQTSPSPTVLSLFETINENLKKIGDTVSKSFDAAKFEETSRNIAKQLDQWGANIKEETEHLKDNEAVKSLRKLVDDAVEEIKKSPDVKAAFEKYKSDSDGFLAKINEIKKTEEPKLQELSKKILEQTTTTLQDIAKVFHPDTSQ
ncbi:uncharacterized protein [Eurosta solidaginis]|uniref:uncharacterized protein n=1 Tax=Eurosta solidaginis TaxID=178769 RepID=UPI0035309D16